MRYLKLLLFIFLINLNFHCGANNKKPGSNRKSIETKGEANNTDFNIYDVHEHIESSKVAYKLLPAMRKHNIKGMILVASPKETLGLVRPKPKSFTDPEWNNEELLKIAKKYPNTFYPFGTFSPADKDQLKKLKAFIERGGKGLKLYNGHSRVYERLPIPLDAPHLMKVYEYCEKNRIPIVYHVSLFRPHFEKGMRSVMKSYPNLVVNIPHFGVTLGKLSRLTWFLDRYPNTYTDVSFGHYKFAYNGMRKISKRIKFMKKFMKHYGKRILFASDMVLTRSRKKDEKYVIDMIQSYRNFLEQKRYTSYIIKKVYRVKKIKRTAKNGFLNGLNLDRETLKYIYEINPKRFLGLN